MHRDLVVRAMAGEHGAFSELVRIGLDQLYVTARLILRDSELAEDAVQEALVAAWRDLSMVVIGRRGRRVAAQAGLRPDQGWRRYDACGGTTHG